METSPIKVTLPDEFLEVYLADRNVTDNCPRTWEGFAYRVTHRMIRRENMCPEATLITEDLAIEESPTNHLCVIGPGWTIWNTDTPPLYAERHLTYTASTHFGGALLIYVRRGTDFKPVSPEVNRAITLAFLTYYAKKLALETNS